MTAVNVICHRNAVHILSDGAVYSHDAPFMPVHLTSKVWLMPHLNAAVAVMGDSVIGPSLHWNLSGAKSFDDMKAGVVSEMNVSAKFVGREPGNVMAIVAGFSTIKGGPDAFIVSNCGQRLFGPTSTVQHTPGEWETADIGLFGVFPANERMQSLIPIAFSHLESHEDFDPVADGLKLFELQRAERMVGIDGYAQLTSVTRDGITTRIIHRWHEDGVAHDQAA